MSQKARPCNPFNVFSEVFQEPCVCVCRASAVRLSVFSLLRCPSRHSALCFGPSMSTPHSCVDLTCDVVPALLQACLSFPLLTWQRSNRVTSRTDDKEMSDVVKVRNSGTSNLPLFSCLLHSKALFIHCCSGKIKSSWFSNNTQGLSNFIASCRAPKVL